MLQRVDEIRRNVTLNFQGGALMSKQKRNNKSVTFTNHLNTEAQQPPKTPADLYKLQYSDVMNTPPTLEKHCKELAENDKTNHYILTVNNPS